MFIAAIHTGEGVRFLAASPCPQQLMLRVAEYVSGNANDVLWQRDAVRVRQLLDSGEPELAINHYFATVGQRWDKEWLVTAAEGQTIQRSPAACPWRSNPAA